LLAHDEHVAQASEAVHRATKHLELTSRSPLVNDFTNINGYRHRLFNNLKSNCGLATFGRLTQTMIKSQESLRLGGRDHWSKGLLMINQFAA
jgi:hypothetical protein